MAGLHIVSSNNVTFEAQLNSDKDDAQGNVGSPDGQQPIDLIVESSTLVTFSNMIVSSVNGEIV